MPCCHPLASEQAQTLLTYCVSPWRMRSQICRMDSQSVSSRSWLVALSTAKTHHYWSLSSVIPWLAPELSNRERTASFPFKTFGLNGKPHENPLDAR